MKKICVALGVLFMAIASAFADDNELVKTATSISTKSSGEISTDSIYWTFPGSAGLNINQAYFSPYCMEGAGSSVSMDAFLNLNANYKKNRVKWDNSFAAKYGLIYSNEFEGDEIRKNIDEFGLYSKFGYKMAQYWYASALASLESQFTSSYSYEKEPYKNSDSTRISSFFAPGYAKISLGFDYVPNKYISLFVSPLTTRFTFCRLNELASNYGMDTISGDKYREINGKKELVQPAEYKKVRSELGAYGILRSDFDITQNIHFFSSLEAFYAYNKAISKYTHEYTKWHGQQDYKDKDFNPETYHDSHPGQDIKKFVHGWYYKWKLELLMKLTKHINVSFKTQLKYDNAEMKTIEGENCGLPFADVQFWESTSLGIAYQF